MREFLNDLRASLSQACPTFIHMPEDVPYPYISLEPEQSLQGYPWGPQMLRLTLKIWSRYQGTREILKLAKETEACLQKYSPKASLKIMESFLTLLKDGKTHVHTFRLKVRLS